MPVLENGKEIADRWMRVTEEAVLPDTGPIILSLAQWQKNRDSLIQRKDPLALLWTSSEMEHWYGENMGVAVYTKTQMGLSAIAVEDFSRFQMMVLDFPKFGNGRGYSFARLLREEYQYKGILRASGNVLRDQYLFMLRCGFDMVEVSDPAKVAGFAQALEEFSVFYQPAADLRKPAWALRHQR